MNTLSVPGCGMSNPFVHRTKIPIIKLLTSIYNISVFIKFI